MTSGSTSRRWAPIRFRAGDRPQITDDVRERCEQVTALQADDTSRFVAAASDLRSRLDPSAGSITTTTCDARFVALFENWAEGCDRFGIDSRSSTIVFPTDHDAASRVEALGFVAYFDDDSELVRDMTISKQYGSRAWADYMFHQNWVIQRMLDLDHDLDLLFQDVDVVWRRDPRRTLRENAQTGVDIQAMYDGPNPRFQPLYANSGFMYFGNSEQVRDFWAEVVDRHDMVGFYRSQQEPLNVLLAAYAHRGLEVSILDEDRFANGHLYCGGRTTPDDPWVTHHSWTRDLAQKLERYDEAGHWFLPDEALREAIDRESDAPSRRPRRDTPKQPAPAAPVSDDTAIGELLELLDRVRRDRDAHARSLEEMRNSRSWRATAPIRRVRDAWLRRRR